VPLGPGQLVPVGVRHCRVVELGETVELGERTRDDADPTDDDGGLTLAFDGEREIALAHRVHVRVTLTDHGPRVLDAHGLLLAAARAGAFVERSAGP